MLKLGCIDFGEVGPIRVHLSNDFFENASYSVVSLSNLSALPEQHCLDLSGHAVLNFLWENNFCELNKKHTNVPFHLPK